MLVLATLIKYIWIVLFYVNLFFPLEHGKIMTVVSC